MNLWTVGVHEPTDEFGHEVDQDLTGSVFEQWPNDIEGVPRPTGRVDEEKTEMKRASKLLDKLEDSWDVVLELSFEDESFDLGSFVEPLPQ